MGRLGRAYESFCLLRGRLGGGEQALIQALKNRHRQKQKPVSGGGHSAAPDGLGLPPEQPSDDGAEELTRAEKEAIGASIDRRARL
jgi:hypothetical protein